MRQQWPWRGFDMCVVLWVECLLNREGVEGEGEKEEEGDDAMTMRCMKVGG